MNVKYDTIEIGALGHSTKDTPYHLYHTITQVNRLQWQTILDNAGEIAITCSRSLYIPCKECQQAPPCLSLSSPVTSPMHVTILIVKLHHLYMIFFFFPYYVFIIAIPGLSSPICIIASYTPCQTLFTHCCPMYCACARDHTHTILLHISTCLM